MGKKLILLLLILLVALPLVGAAPPVLQTTQPGSLEIIAPTYEYVIQGADKDIYWHVFNTSNLLTNTTTTCDYHLYSQQAKGEHTAAFNNVKTFSNGRDFEVEIKGANFTKLGEYCHLIECNTTTQTGGIERCFTVTPTGLNLTTPRAILYIGFLALLILVFVINFVGMGMLPERNARDGEGKLISISYLKYFRNVLWMSGYFLFLGIIYIASNLSFAYLEEQLVAKTLFMIFHIGLALSPVLVIVWLIWIFATMFHDVQFQKMLNRGMFDGGKV